MSPRPPLVLSLMASYPFIRELPTELEELRFYPRSRALGKSTDMLQDLGPGIPMPEPYRQLYMADRDLKPGNLILAVDWGHKAWSGPTLQELAQEPLKLPVTRAPKRAERTVIRTLPDAPGQGYGLLMLLPPPAGLPPDLRLPIISRFY